MATIFRLLRYPRARALAAWMSELVPSSKPLLMRLTCQEMIPSQCSSTDLTHSFTGSAPAAGGRPSAPDGSKGGPAARWGDRHRQARRARAPRQPAGGGRGRRPPPPATAQRGGARRARRRRRLPALGDHPTDRRRVHLRLTPAGRHGLDVLSRAQLADLAGLADELARPESF